MVSVVANAAVGAVALAFRFLRMVAVVVDAAGPHSRSM